MKQPNKNEQAWLDALFSTPGLNYTEAARETYKTKHPHKMGCEIAKRPHVKSAIDKYKRERNERAKIDSDYVLKRLLEIDQMDIIDILNNDLSLKPLKDWPKVWRTCVSSIDITTSNSGDLETTISKIKWPDKLRNLELLGKHSDVNAFGKEKEDSTAEDLVKAIGGVIAQLPN